MFRDFSVAPGVRFRQDVGQTRKPSMAWLLEVRKAPQLLLRRPRTDVLLTAKAAVAVDSLTREAAPAAKLRIKTKRFGFTTTQDLRVSVGCDVTPAATSSAAAAATFAPAAADGSKSGAGLASLAASRLVLGPAVVQPYLKVSDGDLTLRLRRGDWQVAVAF